MPDPRGANPVDLSERWTKHLREHANTTVSYACPNCADRKIHETEDDLWKHTINNHTTLLPHSTDRSALQEFRRNLKIRAAEKGPVKPVSAPVKTPLENKKSFTLQSRDVQSRATANQSKRPFSPTQMTQGSEISGLKDLNIEAEKDSQREDVAEDNLLEPQPKRPAIGEGESPSSSSRARGSQSPPKGSNAARPNSSPCSKKTDSFDYNRDSKAMAGVAQQQSIRPAPTGRRIWNPDTDALPKQSVESLSNRNPKANPKNLTRRDRRPHQFFTEHSMSQRPSSAQAAFQPPVSILGSKSYSNSANREGDNNDDVDIILQPQTRPISQEQLVAEVKGIYAGLVMVEAKCMEVDNDHASAAQNSDPENITKINHEKWQALISLHRTLLHEHHDFFLASQHPSASPALRRLASKYAMPARMWRHGIHSFLELLRHRLPYSLDHMLAFIYLAYSMMALLYETVPAFEETWIECLGDLGRYRMAIEDDDQNREVWTGVARHWYSKASDKSPTTGRLYHHLAILARPNHIQQLFYYAKSLCVLGPFTSARESILTLFEPVLKITTNTVYRTSETMFVAAHGILFTRTHLHNFKDVVNDFIDHLETHIERRGRSWMEQGYFVAVANSVALLGFGSDDNCLMASLAKSDQAVARSFKIEKKGGVPTPSESFEDAQELHNRTLELVLRRGRDTYVLPYIHVTLVFMNHMSNVPGAMKLLESTYPWQLLAEMLNILLRNSMLSERFEGDEFPMPEKNNPRPFPEDYALRGLLWADGLFPDNWFTNPKIDDEEKYVELPSMTDERKERILWLARRIANAGPWLNYDSEVQLFYTDDAADTTCSGTLSHHSEAEPRQLVHALTCASLKTEGEEFTWDISTPQRSDTGWTGTAEADENVSECTGASDDVETT